MLKLKEENKRFRQRMREQTQDLCVQLDNLHHKKKICVEQKSNIEYIYAQKLICKKHLLCLN